MQLYFHGVSLEQYGQFAAVKLAPNYETCVTDRLDTEFFDACNSNTGGPWRS